MKINFENLVLQLLPQHKRKVNRLKLLQAFVKPLASTLQDFYNWQNQERTKINLNSQLMVLEGFLRDKYKQDVGIKIINFDDGLMLVSLKKEDLSGVQQPLFGLKSENVFQEIPLKTERRQSFGDVDFIIYIPQNVDIIAIKADIETYKQVLIRYKIIQK